MTAPRALVRCLPARTARPRRRAVVGSEARFMPPVPATAGARAEAAFYLPEAVAARGGPAAGRAATLARSARRPAAQRSGRANLGESRPSTMPGRVVCQRSPAARPVRPRDVQRYPETVSGPLYGRLPVGKARFGVAWGQVAALYPACSCRIDSCWPRWNQPTRRLTPPEGCFPLRAAPGLAGRGLTCLPSHLVVALRNLSAVHLLRFVAHAPALPNLRRTGQRSSARTPGHGPARPRSCAPSCSPAPRPPHSAADAWPAGAARPTGSWRG